MENNFNDQFYNDLKPAPARPQFLSVLCVLTFIWSGILILGFGLGTLALTISAERSEEFAEKIMESSPNLVITDPESFLHQIGMASLMYLIAKIATLVGAIMMWRLNKIGFFIYTASQIVTYFIGFNITSIEASNQTVGDYILPVLLDAAFITMYALNLKHMNRGNSNTINA